MKRAEGDVSSKIAAFEAIVDERKRESTRYLSPPPRRTIGKEVKKEEEKKNVVPVPTAINKEIKRTSIRAGQPSVDDTAERKEKGGFLFYLLQGTNPPMTKESDHASSEPILNPTVSEIIPKDSSAGEGFLENIEVETEITAGSFDETQLDQIEPPLFQEMEKLTIASILTNNQFSMTVRQYKHNRRSTLYGAASFPGLRGSRDGQEAMQEVYQVQSDLQSPLRKIQSEGSTVRKWKREQKSFRHPADIKEYYQTQRTKHIERGIVKESSPQTSLPANGTLRKWVKNAFIFNNQKDIQIYYEKERFKRRSKSFCY